MKRIELDPVEQLNILNSDYVCADDLTKLYPIKIGLARKIIKKIWQRLDEEGYNHFQFRTKYVPIEYVTELIPVSESKAMKRAKIKSTFS